MHYFNTFTLSAVYYIEPGSGAYFFGQVLNYNGMMKNRCSKISLIIYQNMLRMDAIGQLFMYMLGIKLLIMLRKLESWQANLGCYFCLGIG